MKERVLKRSIAFLLALTIVMQMIPYGAVSVFAEDTEGGTPPSSEQGETLPAEESGTVKETEAAKETETAKEIEADKETEADKEPETSGETGADREAETSGASENSMDIRSVAAPAAFSLEKTARMEEYTLLVNGQSAAGEDHLTVRYGDMLTFSLAGFDGTAEFMYQKGDDWGLISNGRCQLLPGTYTLRYVYYTEDECCDSTGSYAITVEKGILSAPSGLTRKDGGLLWTAPRTTTTGGSIEEGAIGHYTIALYTDGSDPVETAYTTETSYQNLANHFNGTSAAYKIRVSAVVSDGYADRYASSATSEIICVVPSVSVQAGNGIDAVTPTGANVLIPGDSQVSLPILATAQPGYTFDHWEMNCSQGVAFAEGDEKSASASIMVEETYDGPVHLTLTAVGKDTTVPEAGDCVYGGPGVIRATARDDQDGVKWYAFSTKASADQLAAEEWEVLETAVAGADTTVSHTLTEGGSYYFYAKDAAGNIRRSDKAIAVTRIQYQNTTPYGGETSDYLIGDTVPQQLFQPVYSAWNFFGWYPDEACAQDPVVDVPSEQMDTPYVFYAKWDKQSLADTAVSETPFSKEYDGSPLVIPVSLPDGITGSVLYTWTKDGSSGSVQETENSFSVKNVADSGLYSVTVTMKDSADAVIDTKTIENIEVTVTRKPITVKPRDETITLNFPAPEFALDCPELPQGEELTAVFQTSYSPDSVPAPNAGDYEITITHVNGVPVEALDTSSDATLSNYSITVKTGTLTVSPITGDLSVTLTEPGKKYVYTGEAITPDVTVKLGDVLLNPQWYNVAYTDNIHAGQASITVTPKGNYAGEPVCIFFSIERASFDAAVSLEGWKYGEDAGKPEVTNNPGGGEVTFYYAPEGSDSYTTEQPVNAGKYRMYARIAETADYHSVIAYGVSPDAGADGQPVEFEITRRQLTLTANSNEFVFDGLPHADNGWSMSGDGFVNAEGFTSVTVEATGDVTNVPAGEAEPNNIIHYVLNSVTNPDNYDITLVHGTITITPSDLPIPFRANWVSGQPGTVSWVPVMKNNLTTRYVLTLYAAAQDASGDTMIGAKTVDSGSTCDFAEEIREHAQKMGTGWTYSFTIQAKPLGGTDAGNYRESAVSEKTGTQTTSLVKLVRNTGVQAAFIGGEEQEQRILLDGESAEIRAYAQDGYAFSAETSVTASAGLAVSAAYGDGEITGSVTFHADKSDSTASQEVIQFSAQDAAPEILDFSCRRTDGLTKVDLLLSAADGVGIDAYAIRQGEAFPEDEMWIPVEENDSSGLQIEKSLQVTQPGTYYAFVRDTVGNQVRCENPIIIYRVEFAANPADGAEGTMSPILKVHNETVRLPANAFSKEGFSFLNWRSENGVYEDEASYSANGDQTLTAYWSQEQYTYRAEYYYMGADGVYGDQPSVTKEFLAARGTGKSYDTPSLQMPREGFELDSGKQDAITVERNGQVLKIFYRRIRYTLSFSYCLPTGETRTSQTQYYYGATLENAFEKPSLEGYTFVGWLFGDSGTQPAVMPAHDVDATGEFIPERITYEIRHYVQDLNADGTAAQTYTLLKADSAAAEYGTELVFPVDETTGLPQIADEPAGFSYEQWIAATKDQDGTDPASLTPDNTLSKDTCVNVYYSRREYAVSLKVWKGPVGGTGIYENTWPVLYGAAFPENLDSYEMDSWEALLGEDGEAYILADYVGWSTGTAPDTMPAGDVTITRQFVRKVLGAYNVVVHLETATDGVYEERPFSFLGNVGQQITVGSQDTDTVQLSQFGNAIERFADYELVEHAQSKHTGSVTDTNSGEEPMELHVYLNRVEKTVVITYRADQTAIARVTKQVKWGHSYVFEPLALFDGNSAEPEGYEQLAEIDGTTPLAYDFRSNNYVISYTSGCNWGHGGEYKVGTYDSVASLDNTEITRTMCYAGDTVTVFYTLPDPITQYRVEVGYNPTNLNGDDTFYPLTYSYNDTEYYVFLANEAYFHEDAAYHAVSCDAYPGLAMYKANNVNPASPEDIEGYFTYSTDSLKAGFTPVEINGSRYYLQEGNEGVSPALYIPVPSNPFYKGHLASYTFNVSTQPGGQMVTDFLNAYRENHASDPAAANATIWNTSYGSTIRYVEDDARLVITFRKADTYRITYVLGGASCINHLFPTGSEIQPEDVGCTHDIIQQRDGYDIVWYHDSAFTNPVDKAFVLNSNKVLYGKYEKKTITHTVRAYYELPDYESSAFLTAEQIHALMEDGSVTLETDAEGVRTYRCQGAVVMTESTFTGESFSTEAIQPADYLREEFTFDTSNPQNVLSGYCHAEPLTFSVYFARSRYSLTLDTGIPGEPVQTRQYRFGQTVTPVPPARDGYIFDKWLWHEGDTPEAEEGKRSGDFAETFSMPNCGIYVTGQWTARTFDQNVLHYFQDPDTGSYDKEAVKAMREENGGTAVTVVYLDQEYTDGIRYANGGVSFVVGDLTYYCASPVAEGGKYLVPVERLSAAAQSISVTQDEKEKANTYCKTVDHYVYSNTQYLLRDDIEKLAGDQEYTNSWGMELEYYYELQFVTVTALAEATGGNKTMTALGGGTYRYGQTVKLTAEGPAGFTFRGWYETGGVDLNKDPLSEQTEYVFTALDDISCTAVFTPDAIAAPELSVSGIEELTYGYQNSGNLVVSVTADGLEEGYRLTYRWYKNGVEEAGQTSAGYAVPTGWDAGTYTLKCVVTVVREDNGTSMELPPLFHTIVVNRRSLGDFVSLESRSVVFDGEGHSVSVTVRDLPQEDYAVFYSETPFTQGQEGTEENPAYRNVRIEDGAVSAYPVYVHVKALNENYADYNAQASVTIIPRTVTLSAGTASFYKVYDGNTVVSGSATQEGTDLYDLAHGQDGQRAYRINGLVPGDENEGYIISCRAEFNSRHVAEASAITMSEIVVASKNGDIMYNYAFEPLYTVDLPGFITRRPLALEWDVANPMIYKGQEYCPTASIPVDDIAQGYEVLSQDMANLSVTVSGGQTNQGSYSASAILHSGSENTRTDDFSLANGTQPFQIGKRPVTVAMESASYPYDGTPKTLTVVKVGKEAGLLPGHTCYAEAAQAYTDAGSYPIPAQNARILDSDGVDYTDNYQITYSDSGILTISPKVLTVQEITANDKVYDGNTSAELNLENVLTGILPGDELYLNSGKVAGTFLDKNVGTDKTVTVAIEENALSGAAAGNYTLPAKTLYTTATISPRTLTVTAADVKTTYGEEVSFSVRYSGFVGGEEEKAADITGTVGYSIGTTEASLVPYTRKTGAGSYSIWPDVSKLNLQNYAFAPAALGEQGKLTVEKRLVSVTAKEGVSAIVKTYDAGTAVASDAVTTAYYQFASVAGNPASGVANGDQLTVLFDAAYTDANAGDPDVLLSALCLDSAHAANSNYSLVTQQLELPGQIVQRKLTIRAKSGKITYGDPVPQYEAAFEDEGFAPGESVESLTGTLELTGTYDVTKTDTRKVGEYFITPSGVSSGNYEISFGTGLLTVQKAVLTVAAQTDTVLQYGMANKPVYSCTITGFCYTDSEETLSIDPADVTYSDNLTYALVDAEEKLVSIPYGDYSVTPITTQLPELENYSYAPKAAPLTVTKRALTITGIVLPDREYDGSVLITQSQIDGIDKSIINYQGLLSVDRAELEKETGLPFRLDNAVFAQKDVKWENGVVQKIPVTFTVAYGDYLAARYSSSQDQADAQARILPRALVVKANSHSIFYGQDEDTDRLHTVTFDGLVDGETATTANVTIACPYTNDSDNRTAAGVYENQIIISDFHDIEGGPTAENPFTVKNYGPQMVSGTLTVYNHRLDTPQSTWKADSPGTVTWNAVDGIGDVAVDSYRLYLKKDGTVIDDSVTVAADAGLSYDYASVIRGAAGGPGGYQVAVQAIASEENNTGKKNVQDSGADGTSRDGVLYAANVTFRFVPEDLTEADGSVYHQPSDAVKDISIHGAKKTGVETDPYLMLAGESNVPIAALLQNATGYTIGSIRAVTGGQTVVSTLRVADGTDSARSGDQYGSTISMDAGHGSAEDIQLQLRLDSRPAVLDVTIDPYDLPDPLIYENGHVGQAYYGFTEDTAPKFRAYVSHPEDPDHPEEAGWNNDYTCSYVWKLYKSLIPIDTQQGSDTWAMPSDQGFPANTQSLYIVQCVVTATRTDNGRSYTLVEKPSQFWNDYTSSVRNIVILRASFTAEAALSGWTFGEAPNTPRLVNSTVTAEENPKLNQAVFYYRPWQEEDGDFASVSGGESKPWTTEKPTSAGRYYVCASIPQGGNYNSFLTHGTPFTINKAKLTTPENLTHGTKATDYGQICWDAVEGPRANGNGEQVGVSYQVKLYREDTLVETYPNLTDTSLDITEALAAAGTYHYTVQAISAQENNCDHSDVAVSELIHIAAISVDGNSASKKYDGQPITLRVSEEGPASYSWYFKSTANQERTTTTADNALDLIDVVQSGDYICVITKNAQVYYTPRMTASITPRSITMTSGDATAEYSGQPLQNTADPIVSGDGFAPGEGAGYTVTGSCLDVVDNRQKNNTFIYVLNANTKEENYVIEKVFGTLTVRPVSDTLEITANSNSWAYTGETFRDSGFNSSKVLKNPQNERVEATVVGSIRDVRESPKANTVTEWKVLRGDKDISANYAQNIQLTAGSLTVTPSTVPIKITAGSAEREYDGTPLTSSLYSMDGSLFGNDETLVATTSGSITDVGTETNMISGWKILRGTEDISGNYGNVQLEVGTLEVTPSTRRVVLTAGSAKRAYDGTPLTSSDFSVDVTLFGKDEVADVTTSGSITDVGTETNTISGWKILRGTEDVSGNYGNVQLEVGTLEVTPSTRQIVLTAGSAKREYDGTPLTSDKISLDSNLFGSDERVEGTTSGSITDVGTETNAISSWKILRGTKDISGNYGNVQLEVGTLEVTPSTRRIVLTAGSAKREYDGTPLTSDEISLHGTLFGSDEKVEGTTSGSITDVGTETNAISGWTILRGDKDISGNYGNVQLEAGSLEITPSTVPIIITAGSAKRAYDGTPLTSSKYSVAGNLADSSEILEATTSGSITDVGTQENRISGWKVLRGTKDISANYGNVQLEVGSLEITPSTVPIVITAGSAKRAYDGTPLTSSMYSVAGSLADSSEILEATTSGSITDVGTQGNRISGWKVLRGTKDISANYGNVQLKSGNLEVTPSTVPIVITAGSAKKQYDGTALTSSAYSVEGELLGEDEELVVTTGGSITDVGTEENVVSAWKVLRGRQDISANYSAVTTEKGTLEITPIETPIVITAGSAEKTYDGTPLTQNKFEYTGGVVISGDEVTAVLEGTLTDVGTAENTVVSHKILRGGKDISANYPNVTYAEGTLTVNKRKVTLKSQSVEKTYDGETLTGRKVIVGADGFAENEGASYAFGAELVHVGEKKNTFTYTLNSNTDKDNYDITVVYGSLKVTPRPVTITAEDKSSLFGTLEPLTYRVTAGSVLNQDLPSLAIRVTSAVTKQSKPGQYPIRAAYTPNPDYQIQIKDGVYTVLSREIVFEAGDTTVSYDGQLHGIRLQVRQPVSGCRVYYGLKPLTAENYLTESRSEAYQFDEPGEYTVYLYLTAEGCEPCSASARVTILPVQKEAPAPEPGTEDETGISCFWHYLMLLTGLVYSVILLLTRKREELPEEDFRKARTKAKRRRILYGALLVILLVILNILGFCNLDLIVSLIVAAVVALLMGETYHHKFGKDPQTAQQE